MILLKRVGLSLLSAVSLEYLFLSSLQVVAMFNGDSWELKCLGFEHMRRCPSPAQFLTTPAEIVYDLAVRTTGWGPIVSLMLAAIFFAVFTWRERKRKKAVHGPNS